MNKFVMISSPHQQATRPLNILIVDDNEAFRTGVSEFLKKDKSFHIIGEAEDGIEAISQTQLLHPDLILLDISMPRMSGFEAAQKIKAFSPGTKIVFLTIHEEETYQALAESIKVDGYISKNSLKHDLPVLLHRFSSYGTVN